MRRVNKNGDQPIPSLTWGVKASAHRKCAASLAELLIAHESEAGGPLGDALRGLVAQHVRLGDACDLLRSETKKGRPRSKATPEITGGERLKGLLLKKRPGAQRKYTDEDPKLIYCWVTERQAKLKAGNATKATIKAAIDSLNAEVAQGMGKSQTDFMRKNYHSIRALYLRGKKLQRA